MEWRSGGESGIMGCFHSKSVGPRKKTVLDTQPRGMPTPDAKPEVHPEIVHLAEVSSGLCKMKVALILQFSKQKTKTKLAANTIMGVAQFISFLMNSVQCVERTRSEK